MNLSSLVLVAAAGGLSFTSGLRGADPQFVGRYTASGVTYFAVAFEPLAAPAWSRLGQSVGKYRLTSFDPQTETLSLEGDGKSVQVEIRNASVKVVSIPSVASQASAENRPVSKSIGMLAARCDKTREEITGILAKDRLSDAEEGILKELHVRLKREEANLAHLKKALSRSD